MFSKTSHAAKHIHNATVVASYQGNNCTTNLLINQFFYRNKGPEDKISPAENLIIVYVTEALLTNLDLLKTLTHKSRAQGRLKTQDGDILIPQKFETGNKKVVR